MPSSQFYIFKSPAVIMPSFELLRRTSNPISRWWYRRTIEPNYSYNKFMNGAIQATLLAAIHIRERKLDKFREISTEKLTKYLITRLPELPDEVLEQRLNFSREQIVNGFIHASMFSMNNIIEATISKDLGSLSFHSTFAFLIDRTGKILDESSNKEMPILLRKDQQRENSDEEVKIDEDKFPPHSAKSISKLLRRPEQLLVCNITLSRNVGTKDSETFGRWRITDLNFFDCEFAIDKLHTY